MIMSMRPWYSISFVSLNSTSSMLMLTLPHHVRPSTSHIVPLLASTETRILEPAISILHSSQQHAGGTRGAILKGNAVARAKFTSSSLSVLKSTENNGRSYFNEADRPIPFQHNEGILEKYRPQFCDSTRYTSSRTRRVPRATSFCKICVTLKNVESYIRVLARDLVALEIVDHIGGALYRTMHRRTVFHRKDWSQLTKEA